MKRARLIVFRGNGRSFSAGFDLGDVEAQREGDLVLRFVRIEMLLQAVGTSPARTVALAHGKVFGADLFARCRHRIAAAGTTFRMPGLKFGWCWERAASRRSSGPNGRRTCSRKRPPSTPTSPVR